PAVAARQWSGSLAGMVLLAGAIGLVSAVIGAVLSALSPGLSTGPLVVLVATAAVAISLVFGRPSVRGAN
ncbi:MAG TPA: metal ABC transporter permease, partial [Trueperaceae bacterium]|nr:metal ABC transporter permease [Trueperaceae bacterium]